MVDIVVYFRWSLTGRILRGEELVEHGRVPSQGVAPAAG